MDQILSLIRSLPARALKLSLCLRGTQAFPLFYPIAFVKKKKIYFSFSLSLPFDPVRHSRHGSSTAVYLHHREESDLVSLIYTVVISLIMFPSENTKESQ